jgi:hypothetical protein
MRRTASDLPPVSALRLNILRAYYALLAFGTAMVFWPGLLSHSHAWGVNNGAQYSLLAALSPLALLGLRYPLRMLPVILYEFLWKTLWLIFVVAPVFAADRMTEMMWSNLAACALAIVLTPIVLPWRYFWRAYVSAPGDKWRSRPAQPARTSPGRSGGRPCGADQAPSRRAATSPTIRIAATPQSSKAAAVARSLPPPP